MPETPLVELTLTDDELMGLLWVRLTNAVPRLQHHERWRFSVTRAEGATVVRVYPPGER